MKSKKYDGFEIFSLPPGLIIIAIDPASGVQAESFVMERDQVAEFDRRGYFGGQIVYARPGELDLHSLDEKLMADLGWIRDPRWKSQTVEAADE